MRDVDKKGISSQASCQVVETSCQVQMSSTYLMPSPHPSESLKSQQRILEISSENLWNLIRELKSNVNLNRDGDECIQIGKWRALRCGDVITVNYCSSHCHWSAIVIWWDHYSNYCFPYYHLRVMLWWCHNYNHCYSHDHFGIIMMWWCNYCNYCSLGWILNVKVM